jgi:hypothetical protein
MSQRRARTYHQTEGLAVIDESASRATAGRGDALIHTREPYAGFFHIADEKAEALPEKDGFESVDAMSSGPRFCVSHDDVTCRYTGVASACRGPRQLPADAVQGRGNKRMARALRGWQAGSAQRDHGFRPLQGSSRISQERSQS